VARLAPTLLVAFLLAGTAVAFAVTQGLKLEKSPIFGTVFDEVLGPSQPAELGFRLRKRDTVTATVVDADGDAVRTLLDHQRLRAGGVALAWDARTDAGRVAPEGTYRLRVRLADQRGTILIPTDFRLDSTAPTLIVSDPVPSVFSPDGDGHSDRAIVRYRTDEAARVILTVNGRRAVRGKLRERLALSVDTRGLELARGRYVLRLRAEDAAGNISPPSRPLTVRVRYVEIGARRLVARAGRRFRVPLDTDAKTVRWRLAGRSGVGPAHSLRVRAPARPGRYRLYVSVNDHADTAPVVVRAAR
jgi:flagellar hook capping protein FlgD